MSRIGAPPEEERDPFRRALKDAVPPAKGGRGFDTAGGRVGRLFSTERTASADAEEWRAAAALGVDDTHA